ACDIDRIERTREGILRDDGEYIFLLMQLAGTARIEQEGTLEILEPGGCYLLDSTKASRLTYSGERMQLLSVHMPRASFLLEADGNLRIGAALSAKDPMSAELRAFFTGGSGALRRAGTSYRDPRYLFDVARMAFTSEGGARDATRLWSATNRVELAVRIMERNLDRSDLSLQWLAREVNLSPRQLQRDFLGVGTSFVRLLRRKRLALATELLQTATRTRRPQSIADVAVRVGVNDIS
ncbi:helix-turn-helix domain-containing protein, partial [Rhizobiaceae sp. 2RAB30]